MCVTSRCFARLLPVDSKGQQSREWRKGVVVADIFDVAQAIDERMDEPVGMMKLLKLLYFAQGWSLAWTGEELFADDAQAWDMGPVYPAVRNDLRYGGRARKRAADASRLTQRQHLIVDAVTDNYGNMSADGLSAITHSQAPWVEAYRRGRNSVIPKVEMLRDFSVQESPHVDSSVFPPPPKGGDPVVECEEIARDWADVLELLGR